MGNEINNGMSGEKDVSVVNKLLKEGVRAVRNLAKNTKDIKLHFIIHLSRMLKVLQKLLKN